MSSSELPEYAVRNRARWTTTNAEYSHDHGLRAWQAEEITWGLWGVPEAELNALPDVVGKDVVELGCGTAYFSAWLARRGARPVGVDVTPAQLETARRLQEETGIEFPLLEANAEEVPLPDASFDVAVSEYGASIWCDPYRWIPEAARLLRPGGELVFLRNSTLSMLCAALDGWHETLQRPQRGLNRIDWEDDGTTEFHLPLGELYRAAARGRLRRPRHQGAVRARRRREGRVLPLGSGVGEALAVGGDLEGAEAVSSHVVDPILLASTSPQRRVILEQLGLPFDIVAPEYEEHDPPDADVYDLVREHARGKARSVAGLGGPHRPVLGVDTAVAVDGAILGKPANAAEAERMLGRLAGKTHTVVSGLCLLTPGWEVVEHESTDVSFRELTPRELAHHLAHGEWEGRAGAYAIQGRGAALVERIEGDYLNVVGLPAALLVRLLAERFPGAYGFG